MIYELLALRSSADPELSARGREEELSALTWKASLSFEAGDFMAAKRFYENVLERFSDDSVARYMLNEIAGMHPPDLFGPVSDTGGPARTST
jgi:hypothetical protein